MHLDALPRVRRRVDCWRRPRAASVSATQGRSRAVQLAKHDTRSAHAAARAVTDPWFRAQALAWVARFAPGPDLKLLSREALHACDECADPYKRAGSAAWPIRALVERGLASEAHRALSSYAKLLYCVEPASSRSEAGFLLYQASFPLGAEVRAELLGELCSVYASDPHWRCQRNLLDALAMLPGADRTSRNKAVAAIADEKTRAKAERIAPGSCSPRAFFW